MTPTEQPAPVANDATPTWELVIVDLQGRTISPPDILDCVIADAKARDQIGRERYGCPLQPGNGRDSIRDAYEEAMDLAVYLKNAAIEAESRGPGSSPGMGAYQAKFEKGVLRCQYEDALSMCIHLRAAILRREPRS